LTSQKCQGTDKDKDKDEDEDEDKDKDYIFMSSPSAQTTHTFFKAQQRCLSLGHCRSVALRDITSL
jgi:hypothetical protein